MTSQDPGSAAAGGDLGWAGPGTFVPEFETDSSTRSSENEISRAVQDRSSAGTSCSCSGRRTYDATDDVIRNRCFAQLREARPKKKPSCGCVGCATRRSSTTACESRVPSRRPSPSPSGEPAGIGPDLCSGLARRALARAAGRHRRYRLLQARGAASIPQDADASLRSTPPYRAPRRTSNVLHVPLAAPLRAGQLDPRNARYVLALLDRAIDGCLPRRVRGDGHRAGAEERHQRRRHPLSPATPNTSRDAPAQPLPGDDAGRRRPARRARDDASAARAT